jgi:hypothetical protein
MRPSISDPDNKKGKKGFRAAQPRGGEVRGAVACRCWLAAGSLFAGPPAQPIIVASTGRDRIIDPMAAV